MVGGHRKGPPFEGHTALLGLVSGLDASCRAALVTSHAIMLPSSNFANPGMTGAELVKCKSPATLRTRAGSAHLQILVTVSSKGDIRAWRRTSGGNAVATAETQQ